MEQTPSIQWFPGHMAKTRRMIGECLPLVDIVIELRDACIPQSSANPELSGWIAGKKQLIVIAVGGKQHQVRATLQGLIPPLYRIGCFSLGVYGNFA